MIGGVNININNKRLLDRYLILCKNKGLTENSIKAFAGDLNLFLRFIGNKDLINVTHIDIEDFMAYCQTERNNSSWALARKYTTLNSFFTNMIKKEYLDMRNPMDKVDKVKIRKRIKEFLTVDEYNKIIEYLEHQNDLRGLALFTLMYSSACRISEIYQLNRNSFDFECRQFKVIGKGQKERICFFSEDAKNRILDYLHSRIDDLEPLFISREYNRWSKRAIQVFVKSTVKNAGINKYITPHSLRHSILSNLRLNGIPIEDLQLLAGHASLQTTQSVYTHVGLNDIRNKFDEFHNKL